MSLIDARTDAVGPDLTAQICVIGAGAAGITLARSLGDAGIDVLLIESGGLGIEGATQALYRGRNIGHSYYDLLACRLRYFGGTTNHWAGYCRANNPINYEGRPELGVPAWPFSADEAEPYLTRAAEMLKISPKFFQPFQILKEKGIAAEDVVDRGQGEIFTALNQITDHKRLGEIHLDELTASDSVRVVTHLNAVDVGLSADARRIAQVSCNTLSGKSVAVRASAFVLACHSIENARLLLASNSVAASGVGNGRDLVGRYFMEHPQIDAGAMVPGPAFRDFYDRSELVPQGYAALLSLSEAAMRREGVLSYHMSFYGAFASTTARRATRRFADGLLKPYSSDLLEDAQVMLSEMDEIAKWVVDRSGIVSVPNRMKRMPINHTIEQAPNPDSRVVLSADARDPLGSPQADLNWQLSALGFGRFAVEEFEWTDVQERVKGHYHHYGTTRMAEDPSQGVVDADQKVHGVENLY